MGRLAASVVEALRVTFTREALPPPPPDPLRAAAPGLLARLFASERLPPPPERTPSATQAGGLLSLFAPEPLPPDLPPAPRRSGRWLAWIFAAEPLDP